jgi:TonB family protein
MESQDMQLTLGLLPEARTPWEKYVVSYGIQSVVLVVFVIAALAYPEVLVLPVRDYHFISLVSTPPPVPQAPAPVRNFRVPKPVEPVEIPTQRPDAMRVPPELVVKKKPEVPEVQAPRVNLAENKALALPDSGRAIPRQAVRTDVFSTGSSVTPSMAASPEKVQTGGFGSPNGVPSSDPHGRAVTIAPLGGTDLPFGPGYGNGTGGAKGARGVVASAGFGNGVAIGDNSGRVAASRGTVRQAGFGDADVIATPKVKVARTEDSASRTLPAEITYKPRPVYTEEGRKLKIEGEVLLDVVFTANGQIRIVKIMRGLGHGLDESAIQAAEKIQYKPALKNGQPADFEAVLHIVFQLAS